MRIERIDKSMGVTPAMLEDFIAFRFLEHKRDKTRLSYNSLRNELAAIKWWATKEGVQYPSPAELNQFRYACKGYKNLADAVQHAEAFPSSALVKALDIWGSIGTDEACLKHAVLSFMFCAMPRVGEATQDVQANASALRWKQVSFWPSFDEAEYVEVIWGPTKTDPHRELRRPSILRCTCVSRICGFHALWLWRRHRKADGPTRPVFAFRDGTPVRRGHVDTFVKEACLLNGMDGANYTPRTLRAGGATWLFEAGVSLPVVEGAGRWAANSAALRTAYVKFDYVLSSKKIQEQLQKAAARRYLSSKYFVSPTRKD